VWHQISLTETPRSRQSTGMRITALVILATLASSGCIFVNEDVGDHADAGPDAPTCGGTPDATVADAMPGGPDASTSPCDQEVACPTPGSGRVMICGRLIDLQNSQPIVGPTALALKVSFYEALAFANNAATPPEFSVTPDQCGRFVSSTAGHNGVAVPGTMYIAVGVDDVSAPFPGGDFVDTVAAISGVGGARKAGFHAYAMRETTDALWSGAMNPSLVEQGVFAGIFIDTSKPHVGIYNGTPTPGVRLTVADQPVMAPSNDFYFDDAAPLQRTHLGSLGVTGLNGTALLTQGSLDTYNGQGGTSPSCAWAGSLATTVPDTIWVSEREGTCP
jgi:hypothetical protein